MTGDRRIINRALRRPFSAVDETSVAGSYPAMESSKEHRPGEAPRTRRSWQFVLGYGAAQAGAFITFIPLLTLLLPLKAEALAGGEKALLLSQIAMIGGITAAAANYVIGALSDATPGRFGRRRPWMVVGCLGAGSALMAIQVAPDLPILILAVIAFQLAVNAVYGPLLALVPDLVPDGQKGLLSAVAGLALPIANLFTALLAILMIRAPQASYAITAVVAAALILPLALGVREEARPNREAKVRLSLRALKDREFGLAFLARLAAESTVAIHTLFLLFFIQGLPANTLPPGWNAAALFGALLVVSTIAATLAGLIGGVMSDKLRRRRAFVVAGCLAMGAAMTVFVSWPSVAGLATAQILFGVGHGLHAAVVAAMNAEILPEPKQAGRDLGVMNIAVALPQTLAPAGAALLFAAGLPLSAVFASAAVLAALAAGFLGLMRERSRTSLAVEKA